MLISLLQPLSSSPPPGGPRGRRPARPPRRRPFSVRLGLGETLQKPSAKWISSKASCSGSYSWLPACSPSPCCSGKLAEHQVTRSVAPVGPHRRSAQVPVSGEERSGPRAASLSPHQRQFNWVHRCPGLRKDRAARPRPEGRVVVASRDICLLKE